ncbi:hypothetical protein J2S43_006986 [Catenuloplanes nepalensis]|uniref:Uncharacterized protein n=1 Tax=Catenuloplanes nepalensis TaxID=587533 RepID=A0ABT9N446_9ACTN|nr:hypothetical protein [Catenuloplanes nepalensis]MDP9798474.1 hypothetical protein [Catenuloplanes nepalensis]
MNLDDLRAGLAELAEESQPTDLRDRAVATSRRIGRTRLALVAAATVLAVAAASAVVALGRDDDRALPTPVATLPAGATSAIYTANLGGFGNLAVWNGSGVRTLYYRDYPFGRYAGDQFRESLTVSPDGTYLSWLSNAGVHLSRVGDNDMVVLNRQDGDFRVSAGCTVPEWTSDSTRLLITSWEPESNIVEAGWFAVDGGAFTVRDDDDELRYACDVHTNGDWLAYTVSPRLGTFETHVRNLRTGETRMIPDLSENRLDFEISSVSPDGERITARLIDNASDRHLAPPRTLQANHVIDTRTGQTLPFPLAPGRVAAQQLYYTPGGDLVARFVEADRSWLAVYAPDGRLLGEADEPAEVRESVLLRVVMP